MKRLIMLLTITICIAFHVGCSGHLSDNRLTSCDSQCTLTVSKKITLPDDASDIFGVGVKLAPERLPISLNLDLCYIDDQLDKKLPIEKAGLTIDAVAPIVSIAYVY